MRHLVADPERRRHDEFTAFVASHVLPNAEHWDRDQTLPAAMRALLAGSGLLGCTIPVEHGGSGWNTVTFGLLNEAFGRGSSALTGVITVQAMVSMALLKWGTSDQKRAWLPALARGEQLAAFALTEPGAGSALQHLSTSATEEHGGLVLNGTKKWISCAQFADVFLVFAMLNGHSVACLIPRGTPGVRVEPITDLMGFRAAGLGEVHLHDVKVPGANVVGRPGFALSHVVPVGLHYGRISTACSAQGLLRGCFEESVTRAAGRRIGDGLVGDMGMVRTLLARMGTDLEAGGLLCVQACQAEDERLPEAYERALIAKYFTSRSVVRAASDAVQIHGAAGCHGSSAVSRYYRDAKIMEIIEGTTQIHENILGRMFLDRARATAH